ncbi:hypothetical protein V5O48_014967 [Marasmius crinis-equi]|uniref:Uncharacterized protein n=1 Tax=Marasmius crinis-equi TaxID=585013 RepID=A0ABR3EVW1_9AGAR
MSSQSLIQVLTKEKKGRENDPLKQLELDYRTSEVDSDSNTGMIAITSSLRQKFARFYHIHGANKERRRWKEEHRTQKCTNCKSSNLPCTTTPDLKIRCAECHTSVTCSKMETFRRDLMMQKMGIWEVEVWETLNREFLKEKNKRKREDFVESEDDEEDELDSDEEEWQEEGYGKPSARGKSDPEKSPTKIKPPKKVEVVIRTRKQRDREEKNHTETVAGFTRPGEISGPGGTDSPKNQPVETRERKKQRLLTEKTQAVERNTNKNNVKKRATALSISRAALKSDTNLATPFRLMPSPTSTLSQDVVPAVSSRFTLPASTPPSRTPQVPPPTPAANNLESDLRLSVIKRQLEDLCGDLRYGRIDAKSALGRFDEVAARIGRRASVASG